LQLGDFIPVIKKCKEGEPNRGAHLKWNYVTRKIDIIIHLPEVYSSIMAVLKSINVCPKKFEVLKEKFCIIEFMKLCIHETLHIIFLDKTIPSREETFYIIEEILVQSLTDWSLFGKIIMHELLPHADFNYKRKENDSLETFHKKILDLLGYEELTNLISRNHL